MWAWPDGAFFGRQQGRRRQPGHRGARRPPGRQPFLPSPPPSPSGASSQSARGRAQMPVRPVRPTVTPKTPGWEQGAPRGGHPRPRPLQGAGDRVSVLPAHQYSVNSFRPDCYSSSSVVLRNHCPPVFFFAAACFCLTELTHLCQLLSSPGRGRPGPCVEVPFFPQ